MANRRVQVTVDPELERALAAVDPRPASRSRLIRDLALRGALQIGDDRRRRREAEDYLLRVAHGDVELDLDAASALHAARGRPPA